MGQFSKAVDEVDAAENLLLASGNMDDQALFCAWAGRLMDRNGDQLRADSFIAAARGYALCSLKHDVWAQVSFISAMILGNRNAAAELNEYLEPALTSASARIRAQALEWKTMMCGRAGDRATQLVLAEQAWEAISTNPREDQQLAANILYNTAVLAFELCDRNTIAATSERMSHIEWSDGLSLQRFQVTRLAAWGKALDGDHLAAFALWRESALIAPSPAWQVLAYIDRAFLAREMGEYLFAREELARARSIGETVDWEGTNDQERLVLLWLAEITTFVDPVHAQSWLERYKAAKVSMPIHLQLSDDPLVSAPESYTAGIIDNAFGKTDQALSQITVAFKVWKEAGYKWRASQTAVRLLEMGYRNMEVCSYLAEHAPLFPNSWIAARARVLLGESFGAKDGPACTAV